LVSESTTRLWKRMKARCVCATARFSSFPRVGDHRGALLCGSGALAAREVEPVHVGEGVDGIGLPHLEVEAVRLVEVRRFRIRGPGTVQGIEIEARGAGLE
jgi:hypothetical protein